MDFLILGVAAFLAGFVDAVVGGGGLIQLPALFSVLSGTAPATLLGTSKLAGIWGTSVAAVNYMKAVRVQWRVVLPSAMLAFLCAFAGAFTVTHIPPTYLRMALPFILAAVAVYTFMRKDLGVLHQPMFTGDKERTVAMTIAAGVGFYDGFFGPGTGSFFIFLLVHFLGYDFLGASAVAKILNVACNAAAILWFGYSGHIIWHVGLGMAICGVCGSIAGSRLAIRHGSGFVRGMFLIVVICLILKTAYDAFLR